MKIAVLTDSSAYLTKEQQEKYHIDVLPIPIMWGDKTYRDMIDIGYVKGIGPIVIPSYRDSAIC